MKLLKYIFSLNGRDKRRELLVLLDPRHERLVVPKVQGLLPCNLSELLGAPLPAKRSYRPGSLLIAHREEGHKTQLPGVQVAV